MGNPCSGPSRAVAAGSFCARRGSCSHGAAPEAAQSLVQLPLAALASPAWLLLLGRTESPLGPPSHSVLQAEPSQIPDPRHVWSRHSLPITDMCCGFGGPLARAATASLDQTAKVRLGSEQTNVPEVCRPGRVKAWLQQSCPCGLQQLGFLAVSVMTQSCQASWVLPLQTAAVSLHLPSDRVSSCFAVPLVPGGHWAHPSFPFPGVPSVWQDAERGAGSSGHGRHRSWSRVCCSCLAGRLCPGEPDRVRRPQAGQGLFWSR